MALATITNRKERDKQLRRSDILRAAEHVFGIKGYHQATIQDIAAEAQYATGTVYLYFADKETLYFSLIEEKVSNLMSLVKEKTEQVIDARQKIEIFIREKLEFFEKNQDFFRIFAFEFSAVILTIDQKLNQSLRFNEHREYIAYLMKVAQDQNILRKDCNPRHLADILISITTTIVLGCLKNETEKTNKLGDFCGVIMDMFLKGASSR